MAREHQRRGELVEAELRLEQASMLVAGLPPTDARRRTVFGTRARFAEVLAYQGDLQGADALADQLIDEAEREPALGDAALVSLALSVADRRIAAEQAERESNPATEVHSQLRMLRVALETAQTGTANRERLELASRLAAVAYLEGELEVARNAADQALSDARTLTPSDLRQIARLFLIRAKIALEQDDAGSALADAKNALRLSEEIGANVSQIGQCEAILAEALAETGDPERALEVARRARDRLDGDVPLTIHSQRTILTALARIEASLGNAERASRYYDEALELEVEENEFDRRLAGMILEERALMSVVEVEAPRSDGESFGGEQ
jgi:tetratricopeptide (TPR) repeat protein